MTLPVDDGLDFESIRTRASSHPDVLSVTKDPVAREIIWEFEDIDLPPNENPPEGEGWLTFTARPRQGLSTGTTITEKASIVFDFNPPIETNTVNHTIDRDPPETQVDAVGDTNTTTVNVSWTGSDETNGSAVESVTLMAAAGNESFAAVANASADQENLTFEATAGQTYRLATSAQDRVGNIEPEPTEADATISVGLPPVVESLPLDPDGDGLFEDVRGDGGLDIFDVQSLFANLDDPAVQDNAEYYNFQGSDPTQVTPFDVQALFADL